MINIITNCRLFNSPNELVHIILNDDKIEKIVNSIPKNTNLLFNANKKIVAPGLIDIHVHGAGGANPSDANKDDMKIMSESLCKMGTSSFVPTTFYTKGSNNKHLALIANFQAEGAQADNLGIHLEGPFINPIRKGGIPPECISKTDTLVFEGILRSSRSKLKIFTLAPELPGIDKIIKTLKNLDCVCSFGHSDANFLATQNGIDQGISCVTHLNNAMRKYNRDKDHPLEAIVNSKVYVQIIPDGHHLKIEDIKYFYKIFGIDRLICITDGIAACGLPDGEYIFGKKKYRSDQGLAYYSDGSGIIGTTLSLYDIMMKFKEISGCSLRDAIQTASENPARCLGIDDHKGFIKPAYDADLIILDDNHNLKQVIKGGQVVL